MKRFFTAFLALFVLCGCANAPASGQEPDTPAKQINETDEETVYVGQCIDAFLFEKSALPQSTPQNSPLSWKVESGNAELIDGTIRKTDAAAEYEPLSLSVSWNGKSMRFVTNWSGPGRCWSNSGISRPRYPL